MRRRLTASRLVWVVLMLAIVVRIAAIFALGSHVKPSYYDIHIIARNMVAGQGMVFPYGYFCDPTPTSYKSPLYLFFFAFFLQFGRSPAASSWCRPYRLFSRP